MGQKSMKHSKWLLFLIVLVAISRIPFLWPGYGTDPDSWIVVNTAKKIADSGQYQYSRPPAYPLVEIFYSYIWKGGPWVINGATAVFSIFATILFYLILLEHKINRVWLLTLAFAFTPVIYIDSTNSMDYIYALTFILASYLFTLKNRPLCSGVMLGLGVGCRITSGAMAIPLIFIYLKHYKNLRNAIFFTISVFLVSLICFAPVFKRYGLGFFSFNIIGFPSLIIILARMSISVFGLLGAISIMVAILNIFLRLKKTNLSNLKAQCPFLVPWLMIIGFYVLIYFRLPHEPDYLIPIVPFVIMLFGVLGSRAISVFVSIGLIVSSFLFSLDSNGFRMEGPILKEHKDRIETIEYIDSIVDMLESLQKPAVIVCGWYWDWIFNLYPSISKLNGIRFEYLLPEKELEGYLSQGYKIYFLEKADGFEESVYGIKFSHYGAELLCIN